MGEVPSPISAVRGDPKTALAPRFWGTLRIGSPQSWGLGGRNHTCIQQRRNRKFDRLLSDAHIKALPLGEQ